VPTLYKYPYYFSVNMVKDCAKNKIITPAGGQTVEARIGYPVIISLSSFSALITKSSSGTNCLSFFAYSCTLVNNPCPSIYSINSSTKKLKIYTNDLKMVGTVHQIVIKGSLSTSPAVIDTVGMSLTVKFTSILCSNAYLIYYPIFD
jgi:hypothetical protein